MANYHELICGPSAVIVRWGEWGGFTLEKTSSNKQADFRAAIM